MHQLSYYKECYKNYDKYAELLSLLTYNLKHAISNIQSIRNEASHGGAIDRVSCEKIRSLLLGVGRKSIMTDILKCGVDHF